MKKNIDLFEEKLILRNLSEQTIQSYVSTINIVASRLGMKVNEVTEKDLKRYMLEGKDRNISPSTQMMIINSFKAYYREIFKRRFDHDILPRPKMSQKQPNILSVEEVQSLLNSITNLKHKTIVVVMYSCALRVSEVVNLKVSDIDSSLNKINIRNSKGGIDRIVGLDPSMLDMLREYWRVYKPRDYMFEGLTRSKYSDASIQSIIKNGAKRAGITKNVSTHTMRHSSLTQLIKNGVDLRTVQKIAGHKNINTTAGYIRIVDSDIINTPSPISLINIK